MKTALIRGKVLILSILESRDLVNTGVLAAAVWYLMGPRTDIECAGIDPGGENYPLWLIVLFTMPSQAPLPE